MAELHLHLCPRLQYQQSVYGYALCSQTLQRTNDLPATEAGYCGAF